MNTMFGLVRPSAASGAAVTATMKTIISAILLMPLFYHKMFAAAIMSFEVFCPPDF
jgi:hypothetical protein